MNLLELDAVERALSIQEYPDINQLNLYSAMFTQILNRRFNRMSNGNDFPLLI